MGGDPLKTLEEFSPLALHAVMWATTNNDINVRLDGSPRTIILTRKGEESPYQVYALRGDESWEDGVRAVGLL